MTKKLSKAQKDTLTAIRFNYDQERAAGIRYWTKLIKNYDNIKVKLPLSNYQEKLDMYNAGYILWHSTNSRTLQILAEHGLIEYIQEDNRTSYPIDWVKLL